MNLSVPQNPIFAHSENKIFASDVDQYIDCTFAIKTKGTTKFFVNRKYSYEGNCEIDLSEILKMFYYKISQTLPFSGVDFITGENNYNGGELNITLVDNSQNTEVLNYYIINGALQVGETFSGEDQFLNQIPFHFSSFPKDVTKWVKSEKKIERSELINFPEIQKCKGIYISWLNKYGAYDYYLFDGVIELDINSKSISELNGFTLGKNSNRQVKIRARVNEDLKNYTVQKIDPQNTTKKITEALISIIDSPEVYIFRRKGFGINSGEFNNDFSDGFAINPYLNITGDFIKVKEVKGNNKIDFSKQVTPIEYELTLPDEKNIKAI